MQIMAAPVSQGCGFPHKKEHTVNKDQHMTLLKQNRRCSVVALLRTEKIKCKVPAFPPPETAACVFRLQFITIFLCFCPTNSQKRKYVDIFLFRSDHISCTFIKAHPLINLRFYNNHNIKNLISNTFTSHGS